MIEDAEEEDDAATPLTPVEREALIPAYITLRRELNEAEQIGITDADRWAFGRRRNILDETFLRGLHRRMFRAVWLWAGEFRQTPRNIGVDHWLIGVMLNQLLDDTRYWIEHATYQPDEIALRFHHRLVAIHPFPNGNGRHARMAADLLVTSLGRPRFSWGRERVDRSGDTRHHYVAALRAADRHDLTPLFDFARS